MDGKSQVYTYINPQKWEKNPYFEKIKNGIHICASKNMADGIKERYSKKDEFPVVFSIAEAIDALFPNFTSSERKLERYLSLSKIVDGMIVTEENRNRKESFKRNLMDIQETIEHLIFVGISTFDLEKNIENENEKFLCHILKKFEKTPDYKKIGMEKKLDKNGVLEAFRKKLELTDELNGIKPEEKYRLVFHGFYSITPEQQTIFHKLKEAGFQIVFFNLYDTDFENTFGFIKKYLSPEHGWPDFKEWKIENPCDEKLIKIGSKFLNDYEKNRKNYTSIGKKSPGTIYKYPTFFDFLNLSITKYHEIGKKSTGDTRIITTDSKLMNNILTPYYPENYGGNVNFLSLPIGQFISNLHKIVEVDEDGNIKYSMKDSILISLFSSGWLYSPEDKKNAREYLKDLEALLPFFSSFQSLSFDEWIERFQLLTSIHKDIINDYLSSEEDRVIKGIETPFSKFAYLDVPKERVGEILFFVKKIKELAEDLFAKDKKSEIIKNHFEKMRKILEKMSSAIADATVLSEEKQILKELLNKMESIDSESEALIGDLPQAISLYLSGGFSAEDDIFVKNFRDIDGEAFIPDIRRFITCLDKDSFPMPEPKLPWPLSEKSYRNLSDGYPQLKYTLYRKEYIKPISRYLFYNMLEFLDPNLTEMSWIENILDRTDLKENMYSAQLGMEKILKENNETLEEREHKSKEIGLNMKDTPIRKILEKLNSHEDPRAEYKVCHRRFYYGYILNSYPVFSDSFHHKFLFGHLVKFLYNGIPEKNGVESDREIIFENLSPIFPQWNGYQKNMMIYQNTRGEKFEFIHWDSEEFNKIKRFFVLSGIKDFSGIYNSLDDLEFQKTTTEGNLMESVVEERNCRFCPYLLKCSVAHHPIDGEGENHGN